MSLVKALLRDKIVFLNFFNKMIFSFGCGLLSICWMHRLFLYHAAHCVLRKKYTNICVNFIGLSSTTGRYYCISSGYLLGHWWLSMVETKYISSIATKMCHFFNNRQDTYTFHLSIFFLSILLHYEAYKKSQMSNIKVLQQTRTYDVIHECAKVQINISRIFFYLHT